MHRLDHIEEITKKELYHLRSFPPGMCHVGGHAEFKYYDVEKQTLEYPKMKRDLTLIGDHKTDFIYQLVVC